MKTDNLLINYRSQIDTLDKELLELLSRRFEIVKQVWIYKKQNNIKPLQTNRWNELLKEKIEVWEFLWLKEVFIVDIWNRIHKEALKIEE
jgi:chorismate mutase